MDLVTYLRTEYIAAALFTNQTPRIAKVALQLGCEDGRAVTFIPRSIETLIASSTEQDGVLPVSVARQLKTQQDRRGAATVELVDQRADDLKEIEDESIDVVLNMHSGEKLLENGLDWKKSVREAARVLRPGGRLLFVERTELGGESYLDYVQSLTSFKDDDDDDSSNEADEERSTVFEVGSDDVDLVLTPHIAGVAVKLETAGMTPSERASREVAQRKANEASLSLEAFERGLKKRKRKKKKADKEEASAQ